MENKPLEQMTDDELLQLHAKEVGLDSLSDDQLKKLTEIHANEPKESSGLGRAFVKSLPIAGGMLGGGVGGLAGGVGAIPGAAAGAATGKAAQNVIEGLYYDEPKTRTELLVGPALEAVAAGTGEWASPAVMALAGKGLNLAGQGIKKTASNFSMLPEKVLETYWKRPEEVAKIPMNVESPIAQAVQAFRQRTNDLKKQFMSVRNAKIAQSLQEKGSQLVDIEPIASIYEDALTKGTKKYGAEARGRIQEQLNILKNAANENGQLEASEVFQMTKDLDQLANYMPASQELKQAKDFADVTFMRAAGRARQITGRVLPEARQAMQEIAPLRRVGQNKPILNIMDVNKPYAPIMGVGTGQNQQNIMNLRKLGNILGEDLVGQAENIASAQYMGNASIVPNVQTGARNAVMQAISGGAGYAAGGLTGAAIPTLGIAAFSSPLVVKKTIDVARGLSKMAPEAGSQYIQKMIQGAIQQGISPVMIDQGIKGMENLTSTEKAQLRKEITKGQ